jgi:hypothetical protein
MALFTMFGTIAQTDYYTLVQSYPVLSVLELSLRILQIAHDMLCLSEFLFLR